MALQRWIDALRRRWVAVVLLVAVCTAGAIGLSRLATPVYESSAALFFSLQYGSSANDLAQGSTFTQDQMASYATLVTTPVVLDPVIEQLGLAGDAGDLARRVTATAPDGQVVLTVRVSDTSPERAAATAAAIATELTSTVEEIAPPVVGAPDSDGADQSSVAVNLVRPATVPEFQSAPNTRMNAVLGLLLGLVLGGLYVTAREMLDVRVRDGQRVAALTDAPLLGSIPELLTRVRSHTVVAERPLSPEAEAYRQLATNVEFLRDAGGPIQLLVSSSLPAEGKSTIAINMALALAESDQRVLLVDADLRRPTIAHKLDLEGSVGLSTLLVGKAELHHVVQEAGEHGLHVLTAGAVPPNPGQLLASPRLSALFVDLRDRYDVVVVDTAPALPVSDALLLSRHVDGTILVVSGRRVTRNQLAETLRRMETVKASLLGVVLNEVDQSEQPYGYGGYGSLDPLETDVAPGPRWRRVFSGRTPSVPAPSPSATQTAEVPAARRPTTASGELVELRMLSEPEGAAAEPRAVSEPAGASRSVVKRPAARERARGMGTSRRGSTGRG